MPTAEISNNKIKKNIEGCTYIEKIYHTYTRYPLFKRLRDSSAFQFCASPAVKKLAIIVIPRAGLKGKIISLTKLAPDIINRERFYYEGNNYRPTHSGLSTCQETRQILQTYQISPFGTQNCTLLTLSSINKSKVNHK